MKPLFFLLQFVPFILFSQSPFVFDYTSVFINEIHYDNVGSDINEGFEIAALTGSDLSCCKIYFVNGNNSEIYSSLVLDTVVTENICGMGFVFFYKPSIQNGASTSGDAIALYNECEDSLIQFLSYEGQVTSVNGPFSGQTSTDIGVFQNGDPIGTSLQLKGSLDSIFYWESDSSTYGQINQQQNFCQQRIELSTIELESSCVLSNNESVSLQLKNVSYSNQIDSVIVFFQSNDSTLLSDTIGLYLTVGDSVMYTFSEGFDLSQAGDYYFEAWAILENETTSDTLLDSINIMDDDSIHIVLQEQLVFCKSNDSLVLEAQINGADLYVWNTGDTNQQIVVFPYSDTTFQIIAHNNCYVDTATVVIDFADPEITFFITTLEGDTFYENYEWWGGQNQTIVHLGVNLTEQVQLTTIESFESYTYYFIPNTYSSDTTFIYDSIIVLTDDSVGGISYTGCCHVETWIYLQATDSFGCTIKDSTMVMIEIISIQKNTLHPFKLYPNPARDIVNLSLDEQLSVNTIWLMNLQGKVLRRFDPNMKMLALDNIHAGTYFLKLHTNKGVFTNRLIILK